MKDLRWLGTLLIKVFIWFHLGNSAHSASLVTNPCEEGYFAPRHADCRPCRDCGQRRIIRICTPTQDTVCSDDLSTRVTHLDCFDGMGMFVEGRSTTCRRYITIKEQKHACAILLRYKKQILHHQHNKKDVQLCTVGGQYQWNTSVGCLDCRECEAGAKAVGGCKGMIDTACSFPRVKNAVELLRIACHDPGPLIQVYSTQPSFAPQYKLARYEGKLAHRFCKILKSRRKSKKIKQFHQQNTGFKPATSKDGSGDEQRLDGLPPLQVTENQIQATKSEKNRSATLEGGSREERKDVTVSPEFSFSLKTYYQSEETNTSSSNTTHVQGPPNETNSKPVSTNELIGPIRNLRPQGKRDNWENDDTIQGEAALTTPPTLKDNNEDKDSKNIPLAVAIPTILTIVCAGIVAILVVTIGCRGYFKRKHAQKSDFTYEKRDIGESLKAEFNTPSTPYKHFAEDYNQVKAPGVSVRSHACVI